MLNHKLARVSVAVVLSLIGLATNGILYLWVWMLMILNTLQVFTEADIAMSPYIPPMLLLALAVPFFLLNWWWASMIYGVFRVPMTGLKEWLAESTPYRRLHEA
jgi:hypothetical protein